jgi:hypothetical protein
MVHKRQCRRYHGIKTNVRIGMKAIDHPINVKINQNKNMVKQILKMMKEKIERNIR